MTNYCASDDSYGRASILYHTCKHAQSTDGIKMIEKALQEAAQKGVAAGAELVVFNISNRINIFEAVSAGDTSQTADDIRYGFTEALAAAKRAYDMLKG